MKKIFFVSIMLIVLLSSVTAITPVLGGGDNELVPGGRSTPGDIPTPVDPEFPAPAELWSPSGWATASKRTYQLYPYVSSMELTPELNGNSVVITFNDHLDFSAPVTFAISNRGSDEIELKEGSKIDGLIGTEVLGIRNVEDLYEPDFADMWIRFAFEALSVEELVALGKLTQDPYVDENGNTVYTVDLNIRLMGWADTTERYCPLVWYYGDPATAADDWLYLVTVNNDDPIYMNPDCSSMFRNCTGGGLREIHFSDRMHFERVTSMASMFSLDGYQTFLGGMTQGGSTTYTALMGLKSVDFSNCNLSSLANTSKMFFDCVGLEIVNLSSLTSCPATTTKMFGANYIPIREDAMALIFDSALTIGGRTATTWPNKSVSITLNNELFVGFTFGFEGQDIPVYSVNLDYPDYSSYTNVNNQAYDKNGVTEFRVEGQQAQKFTFKVAASQMTKPLIIKYSLGLSGAKECEQEFVFADIAKQYKTYEGGKYANLMDAMLVYGKYAQLYFGVDIDSLPTELEVDTASVSAGATANAVQYSYKGKATYPKAGDGFGIAFLGNSLLCYSEMTVRHSFSLPNGIDWSTYDVSVTGDVKCKQGKLDDRLILDITGFPPSDFDREYTVTVTRKDNANESFSITYSPVSYLVGAMKNSNDTKLNDICAAAYQYHKKAEDLFDAVN